MTAKFRRALESHVDIPAESKADTRRDGATDREGKRLLVGFSGGVGSTVLLDAIERVYFPAQRTSKGGKAHPRHKKMWDKVYVCYVEVCDAFPEVRVLSCIYFSRRID